MNPNESILCLVLYAKKTLKLKIRDKAFWYSYPSLKVTQIFIVCKTFKLWKYNPFSKSICTIQYYCKKKKKCITFSKTFSNLHYHYHYINDNENIVWFVYSFLFRACYAVGIMYTGHVQCMYRVYTFLYTKAWPESCVGVRESRIIRKSITL